MTEANAQLTQALKDYFAASGRACSTLIETLTPEATMKLCSFLEKGCVLGVDTVFGLEGAEVRVFAQAPDGSRVTLQSASMPKANFQTH